MTLDIKTPESLKLFAKLDQHKGKSMTKVITDAVRKERAENEREDEAKRRYDAIMKIACEASELIGPDSLPDHAELLYDPETGLPK